jgi:helicase
MTFRGCFVGIDRYAAPSISELASAVRDAEALHALFVDNLAGDARLILNEQATATALRAALIDLRRCDTSDVVVIAFSGHGTSTHELVAYDADIDDLHGSCVTLDELTELVSQIPARQLVCILDCCFAGGAGAKVLNSPRRPRAADVLESASEKLDAMSGRGRLILTAAAADEAAWEDGRLGHGLLTYALLEALQGAESVRVGDVVPIYKLLRYVVEQVRSGAATHGAQQTATLRGQMDGEITWPVFARGPLYLDRFPERGAERVTADIDSLRQAGFPSELLGAWASHIPTLNALQQDAVNDFGLLAGSHLLVSAPTSSGKTLLGELVALQAAGARQRSVFLLPTRALVNDKFDHFNSAYGSLGVRVVRATGEIADDVPALLRGQFDIALLTYEKFAGLALAAPHLLRMLAVVVVDEVQTITDASRGVNLEFLLTLIRSRREEGIEPQLVLLSAVLGDIAGFDTWLNARYLRRTERPVRLQEGVVRSDGTWRHLDVDGTEYTTNAFVTEGVRGSSRDVLVPLVRRLATEGKQVLIFRNQRGVTRGCARYLAQTLGLPPATEVLNELPVGDPSGASEDLRAVLAGGVAFHNAELDRDEKQALERHFRRRDTTLRVIVATTTLAQGINTPAEAVIVAELDHPAGGGQSTPYSVAEYKNIIGRAGRLGFSESGQSFLLVEGSVDEDRKWRHYVLGSPEDLRSTLLDPKLDEFTLVLRVLATATEAARGIESSGMTIDDVAAFLSMSFGAHQAEREGRVRFEADGIRSVLTDLLRAELVDESEGLLTLTELGRLAGSGVVTARTVLRIADFFGAVPPNELNRATVICAAQVSDELEATQMPVNSRGWQKEQMTYGGVLQQQGAGVALNILFSGGRRIAIQRAKRAVGCLLWMDGALRASIDEAITRHIPSRDGAAYARDAASRTRDVIDIVLRIAQLRHPMANLTHLNETLPVQLELGVPGAAVPIARVAGNRLTRGDYLQLQAAGLLDAASIHAASDDELLACVGGRRRRLQAVRDAAARADDTEPAQDIASLLAPPPVANNETA